MSAEPGRGCAEAASPQNLRAPRATPLLLVLLLSCCCMSTRVNSTLLPDHLHARLRHHTTNHLLQSQAAGHVAAAAAEGFSDLSRGPASRHLLASAAAPIRISPQLELPSSMSTANKNTIAQAVTATIQTLQLFLQVRQPVGPSGLLVAPQYVTTSQCASYRASSTSAYTCAAAGFYPSFNASLPASDILAPTCGTATINPAHVMSAAACRLRGSNSAMDPTCTTSASGAGGGSQTDHYLYITSARAECTSGVLAFAAPCLFDLDTNRPVMSYFNVCPLALTSLTTDQLISTMTHEMTHALGFSPDLWDPTGVPGGPSMFINDAGNSLLASSVVVYKSPSPSQVTGARAATYLLVSPRVLTEVRAHFGCPSLVGGVLEDNGGSGSAGSHWEFELFQGDLMTPEGPADADWQRISRMTLALLEDSGWYFGMWSQAYTLQWGRGAGCGMSALTCTQFQASNSSQPYYCNSFSSSVGECTFNGRSWGTCYQDSQFSSCGIVTTYNSQTSDVLEPACISSAYSLYGTTGPTARCLAGPTGFSLPLSSSPCWTAQCTAPGASPLVLSYRQGSGPGSGAVACTLPLPAAGNPAQCPEDIAAVCATLQCPAAGCSAAGGDCFAGACACRLGYQGADCGQRVNGSVSTGGGLNPAATSPSGSPSPSPSGAQGVRPGGVAVMAACAALSVMLLRKL